MLEIVQPQYAIQRVEKPVLAVTHKLIQKMKAESPCLLRTCYNMHQTFDSEWQCFECYICY